MKFGLFLLVLAFLAIVSASPLIFSTDFKRATFTDCYVGIPCSVTCGNPPCMPKDTTHCAYPYSATDCLAWVTFDACFTANTPCIVDCGPTCNFICDSCSPDTGHP
ncbi:13260_t:CDS:1, partial [Racocetra persica]